jgi:hypothetical protein
LLKAAVPLLAPSSNAARALPLPLPLPLPLHHPLPLPLPLSLLLGFGLGLTLQADYQGREEAAGSTTVSAFKASQGVESISTLKHTEQILRPTTNQRRNQAPSSTYNKKDNNRKKSHKSLKGERKSIPAAFLSSLSPRSLLQYSLLQICRLFINRAPSDALP